jgi:organic radical activating enzyme
MKARVIITLDCPRNCENCCNKENVFYQHKLLENKEKLLKYDVIMITGGEPMLIPDYVFRFVLWLKNENYKGKIYLYTALYNISLYAAYDSLLTLIDGIHFTVHYEATDKEIKELKELSENVITHTWDFSKPRCQSYRLAIDSRLYDKYDFSNINFSQWSVIRKMHWMKECPLPKGEELFLMDIKNEIF